MRWLQTLVLVHLMLLLLLLFCLRHVKAGTEQDGKENGILRKLADSSDDIGILKRIVSDLQHISQTKILRKLADSSDDIGILKRIVSDLQHISQTNAAGETNVQSDSILLQNVLGNSNTGLVQKPKRKRTCLLNLGGHCSTENAASLADRWHYLNSPMSPGRKRADPRRYRKFAPRKISNRNKLESR